ncbi:ATP-binding protein [Amaricoccus sp.]|uniref:ATP-binding protein n=1 Tax=Amaricoccus sp. TaxID=1872485 RepID=UPI001B771743|nr:ATP-binding protein [Amaricoccus sp.]MBP7002309.1 ATP-binding protein [Amaricoccus sp.]
MTELLDRIRASLVGLRMPRALEALDHTLRRLERGELSALEAIDGLLAEEHANRETRRIAVALKTARLNPPKTLEGFDFSFQPSLDRNRILALAELHFVARAEVLHFLGPPGAGKSQVSIAPPDSMPRGRARSAWLRRGDRGSDPVPGMPGTGQGVGASQAGSGSEDPERSEDRLVTVMLSARSGRADEGKCNAIVAVSTDWPATNDIPVCAGRCAVPKQKEHAMTRRTLGIDLAIRGDQIAQIFDDGRPVGKPIRFRLDPASLDGFVAKATASLQPGSTIQALMEPTGMSWFPVAHRLVDAGVEVIRIKGQRVRALRRYLSEHAKTDFADAHLLAAMPLFGGPGLDPVHIPAPMSHALQRFTKQRARFQDVVAGAKRRLLDLVRWASPSLEAVLPDLRTRLSLALLKSWFDPHAVLKARRSTLARFIARNASGNHPHSGPFVETLVDGLKRAARDALALHGRHIDFVELQAELVTEIEVLVAHLDAIAGLERRIAALYATPRSTPPTPYAPSPASARISPRC